MNLNNIGVRLKLMQKPVFSSGEIYHVYNRGVEKRNVFKNDLDRIRFIHDLFEFNDQSPALNVNYYFNHKSMEVEPQYIKAERKPRKLLVEILSFCLMPNHYHMLLRQKLDGGIVDFMQKLGTGYTMYFNQKYDRVGSLFQGRFKAILVKDDAHLLHLPFYIHLNPLDLITPEWRERKIGNYKKAIDFLESYRWSSHLDYLGKKNFPSVTQREVLLEFFNGSQNYARDMYQWLKNLNLETVQGVSLEPTIYGG